jgi:hypothetical protein
LHTLPFCDEFLASEDALDFARMARERRAEQAVEESN